jgi:hypothetical protein
MEVGEPGSADAAKINLAQCMTGLYAADLEEAETTRTA